MKDEKEKAVRALKAAKTKLEKSAAIEEVIFLEFLSKIISTAIVLVSDQHACLVRMRILVLDQYETIRNKFALAWE